MNRIVILDTETTGLYPDEGERLISIGMVELIDDQPTGRTFHAIFNPQKESVPLALKAHRMTPEFLEQFPPFHFQAAMDIFNFIGDSPIITTSRDKERHGRPFMFDHAFVVANEFDMVGAPRPADRLWVNVRFWAEALYGYDGSKLDSLLDRYGINRSQRDALGHGALLDAQLLAAFYPRLKQEYQALKSTRTGPKSPAHKI